MLGSVQTCGSALARGPLVCCAGGVAAQGGVRVRTPHPLEQDGSSILGSHEKLLPSGKQVGGEVLAH
jgi:hypothetical protein